MYRPKGGAPAGDIEFRYVFRDLNLDDEADFLAALKPDAEGKLEALAKAPIIHTMYR